MSRRTIRCAVYTRKSSEEGLDQDFNSLDAQYEACAAYIASQKHEGWKLLPQRYDDGGVSGGTLERPNLQRLLVDVDGGLIDMIVVYKIDRLTRSLSDFSRLIERLEKADCSFVSVTQSFNTSTSMGRLTLNVLLSFAQFEREVTGERIRDKIAASKKKGMWMGGLTPLGYDHQTQPRGLIINQAEAETVREIFNLYDQYGCLAKVARLAEQRGIRSKYRQFKGGRKVGGAIMSRGQIHFVLTNPAYIGLIRHKQETHPGQHEPIVDKELWDRVQQELQDASARPRDSKGGDAHSPLTGKLFDDRGRRLTPTHAQKSKRRHRYYVSSHLVKGSVDDKRDGWRLPAMPLERLVIDAIREHCKTYAQRLLSSPDAGTLQQASKKLSDVAEEDAACLTMLERISVAPGTLRVQLSAARLTEQLQLNIDAIESDRLVFMIPFTLRRRGVELKLLSGTSKTQPDQTLIRAIALAHDWLFEIKAGRSVVDLANGRNTSDAPIRKRLPLAFLSPKIVAAVLEGTQPVDLTLKKLMARQIPLDWAEQERQFGFKD